MAFAEMPTWSLRRERDASNRLAWAFAISLVIHLLLAGTWEAGRKYGWWQNIHLPRWMQSAKMLTELLKKAPPTASLPQEAPLMFVDVNPAVATADAPKDAKFYSDKNSRAANPEADKETGVPKITGNQTKVVKTEDVPREQFVPLQPARPAQQATEEQPELKAAAKPPPGDLAMAKPETNPNTDKGQDQISRPRTIKEALARKQPANRLPAQKMQQEGGVSRHLELASLDAKATPFGAYDAALVEAISQRWFSLLDQRDYASDSRGKVVVQFRLHYDGRITDMSIAENTAGEVLGLICQKAVMDPAPFATWPSDMRRMLGDTRSIQFTFYYN